ncbi:MAG: TonB-dependent receptor, partial [Bacteroidota bacterium]
SKVENVLSPGMRLSGQGIYSLRDWRDYEFSWRFNLAGLPSRTRHAYRLAATLSHTLSNDSYYTLSLSGYYLRSKIGEGSKSDLDLQPYEYDFFLRYIVDGKRNWWAESHQVVYTAKGDFTRQFAKMHLVKAGAEINLYKITSDLVKYEPQVTYFGKPVLDAPLLNYSNRYTYRPRSGSIFIQDKVELVRDGSNFSLGLRWDFLDPTAERPIVEYIPVTGNEYQQVVTGTARARMKHQLSPRLSFAAPVGPLSFFFINFGHYFQFPLFDYLYSGLSPSQLRGGARNVLAGNPDLDPERTIAWETGFKHGVSANVVVSLTYFRKKFLNQIDTKTLVPFDSKSAGDYGFSNYVNNAEASASGIEVVLSREADERLSGSLSYGYMVTDGLSEAVDQGVNFAQWGFPVVATAFPLSWDQRHTIKADADFRLPGDVRANLLVLYNSPRPYTYYPTRDGFTPIDTGRAFIPNNRRMENVLIVNLKLSRQFTVEELGRTRAVVFADIRNLLNEKNVRWIDSNGRIGGELRDPGAYYEPRRIRVGVRFEF